MTDKQTDLAGPLGSALERPVGRPVPDRLLFSDVCALMPEGVHWGEHLTPQIARELVESAVYAERDRCTGCVRAVLTQIENMDDENPEPDLSCIDWLRAAIAEIVGPNLRMRDTFGAERHLPVGQPVNKGTKGGV